MQKLFYLVSFSIILFLGCNSGTSKSQNKLAAEAADIEKGDFKKVTFKAEDGLIVTADYYPNSDAERIIILCHQAGHSRGEYKDIAPRLVDSGYACLSVDLRFGNFVFDVINETAALAKKNNVPASNYDALKDITAAINYVDSNSTKKIYLWGSSYSASLALMVAKTDDRIKRVIAFSPGEYFANQNTVKPKIMGLNTPVFITGSKIEYKIVVEPLINVLPKHNVTAYMPNFQTDHGSKTLWPTMVNADEVYAELFKFL